MKYDVCCDWYKHTEFETTEEVVEFIKAEYETDAIRRGCALFLRERIIHEDSSYGNDLLDALLLLDGRGPDVDDVLDRMMDECINQGYIDIRVINVMVTAIEEE